MFKSQNQTQISRGPESQPQSTELLNRHEAISKLFSNLSPETTEFLAPLLGIDYGAISLIELKTGTNAEQVPVNYYQDCNINQVISAFFTTSQIKGPPKGQGNGCCDITNAEGWVIHVHNHYLNPNGPKLQLAISAWLETQGLLPGNTSQLILASLIANQPRFAHLIPSEIPLEIFRAIDEIIVNQVGEEQITQHLFGLIETVKSTEILTTQRRFGLVADIIGVSATQPTDDYLRHQVLETGRQLGVASLMDSDYPDSQSQILSQQQTQEFFQAISNYRLNHKSNNQVYTQTLALLHQTQVTNELWYRVRTAIQNNSNPQSLDQHQRSLLLSWEAEILTRPDTTTITPEERDVLNYAQTVRESLSLNFIHFDEKVLAHTEGIYHFEIQADGSMDACNHHAQELDQQLEQRFEQAQAHHQELENQQTLEQQDLHENLFLNPYEAWWVLEMQRQLVESQTETGFGFDESTHATSGVVVGVGLVGASDRGVVVEPRNRGSETSTEPLPWDTTNSTGFGYDLFGFHSDQTEPPLSEAMGSSPQANPDTVARPALAVGLQNDANKASDSIAIHRTLSKDGRVGEINGDAVLTSWNPAGGRVIGSNPKASPDSTAPLQNDGRGMDISKDITSPTSPVMMLPKGDEQQLDPGENLPQTFSLNGEKAHGQSAQQLNRSEIKVGSTLRAALQATDETTHVTTSSSLKAAEIRVIGSNQTTDSARPAVAVGHQNDTTASSGNVTKSRVMAYTNESAQVVGTSSWNTDESQVRGTLSANESDAVLSLEPGTHERVTEHTISDNPVAYTFVNGLQEPEIINGTYSVVDEGLLYFSHADAAIAIRLDPFGNTPIDLTNVFAARQMTSSALRAAMN